MHSHRHQIVRPREGHGKPQERLEGPPRRNTGQSGSLSFNRQSRVGVGRVDKWGLAPMVSRAWPSQPAMRGQVSTLGCRINDYAGSCFLGDQDQPTRCPPRPILSRLGAGMVTYPCHSTHFSLFRCIVHAEMPPCSLFMIAEKEKSKGSDKSINSPYARVRTSVAIE